MDATGFNSRIISLMEQWQADFNPGAIPDVTKTL